MEHVDLSTLDYETWLSFIFESPRDYADDALELVMSKPSKDLDHFTRMCSEFAIVGEKYSLQQIDNGIWRLFDSGALYPSFSTCLVIPNEKVAPLSTQVRSIKSIYSVYLDFVSVSTVEVMENCFYMWWCDLNFTFWMNVNRTNPQANMRTEADFDLVCKGLTAQQKEIHEAMFSTLVKIFGISEPRTQEAALHGLGTLMHPSVKDLVQKFIDDNGHDFDPAGVRWLEQCRDSTVS